MIRVDEQIIFIQSAQYVKYIHCQCVIRSWHSNQNNAEFCDQNNANVLHFIYDQSADGKD